MAKSNSRIIADLLSDNADQQLTFEGSTHDNNETVIKVTDPTSDRTITYPDDSGIVALTKNTVSNTVFQSSLANTNLAISTETARTDLLNTNLTSTNTAIRGLVTTESGRVDLLNTNLTSTNSAIRTLVSDRMQVANTTLLVSDRMQVSNVQSYIANTNARLTVLEADSLNTLISTSETTVVGDSNTSIDTVSTSTADAVTWQVVSTKAGDYNYTTIAAVKNSSSSVSFTEYGSIAGDSSLSTFSVEVSGGNIALYADPTTTGVTFKVTKTIVSS